MKDFFHYFDALSGFEKFVVVGYLISSLAFIIEMVIAFIINFKEHKVLYTIMFFTFLLCLIFGITDRIVFAGYHLPK